MTIETELAQALDAAYAAYKRRVGRPYAMERLRNMLARDEEAQRVLDTAKAVLSGDIPRAAE